MGLGCTKDSLGVILGLSGGTPAGQRFVPAPGKEARVKGQGKGQGGRQVRLDRGG